MQLSPQERYPSHAAQALTKELSAYWCPTPHTALGASDMYALDMASVIQNINL